MVSTPAIRWRSETASRRDWRTIAATEPARATARASTRAVSKRCSRIISSLFRVKVRAPRDPLASIAARSTQLNLDVGANPGRDGQGYSPGARNPGQQTGDCVRDLGGRAANGALAAGRRGERLQAILIRSVEPVRLIVEMDHKQGRLQRPRILHQFGDLLLNQRLGKTPAEIVRIALVDDRVRVVLPVTVDAAVGEI